MTTVMAKMKKVRVQSIKCKFLLHVSQKFRSVMAEKDADSHTKADREKHITFFDVLSAFSVELFPVNLHIYGMLWFIQY